MIIVTRYRKFIAAILGLASTAVSIGLIPFPEKDWITAAIAAAAAFGVYALPNTEPSK